MNVVQFPEDGSLVVSVKLASGVSCGPGTLINIDSNGEGVLASDTNSLTARGVALTSGAGTKTTGISQYVAIARHARVTDITYVTLTKGGVVYMTDSGRYSTSAPGTLNQKVGVALDTDEVWVDLDM